MSDDPVWPAELILDTAGAPCGVWRADRDPSEPDRLHPVPRRNASGDPILNEDGSVSAMLLPLDDPRTVAQLGVEGLRVEGVSLVEVETEVPESEA